MAFIDFFEIVHCDWALNQTIFNFDPKTGCIDIKSWMLPERLQVVFGEIRNPDKEANIELYCKVNPPALHFTVRLKGLFEAFYNKNNEVIKDLAQLLPFLPLMKLIEAGYEPCECGETRCVYSRDDECFKCKKCGASRFTDGEAMFVKKPKKKEEASDG